MFLAMFVCGAVISRICLALGMQSLIQRNLIVTLGCYGVFLVLMALYVRAIRNRRDFMMEAAYERPEMSSSGNGGDWSWGDLGVGDSDGCLLLFVILALILLVGGWIGVEGPALLVDEALAAAIAAGLAPKKGYAYEDAWYWRVIPRSLISLVIFLACSSTLLGIAEKHCPGRVRLSEVVKECVLSAGADRR